MSRDRDRASDDRRARAVTEAGIARQLGELRQPVSPQLRVAILDRTGLVDHYAPVATPLGDGLVAFNQRGASLLHVSIDEAEFAEMFAARIGRPLLPASRPPADVVRALQSGWDPSVAADLRSLGEFQRDVLTVTREIPPGQVRSYGWVAARIGRPSAVRAVGTALAKNPVPLLIPCHRVVRSDGTFGQYLFGTEAKARLLRDEGARLDLPAPIDQGAPTGRFPHRGI